jgi:hypothetical protein
MLLLQPSLSRLIKIKAVPLMLNKLISQTRNKNKNPATPISSHFCHQFNVFVFTFIFELLLSEGRAGETWELANKVILFFMPKRKCLSLLLRHPLFPLFYYILRLSFSFSYRYWITKTSFLVCLWLLQHAEKCVVANINYLQVILTNKNGDVSVCLANHEDLQPLLRLSISILCCIAFIMIRT